MATNPTDRNNRTKPLAPVYVVGGRKAESGQEEWFVTTVGGPVTMVTSASTAAAMDEAIELYSEALKRLAKR